MSKSTILGKWWFCWLLLLNQVPAGKKAESFFALWAVVRKESRIEKTGNIPQAWRSINCNTEYDRKVDGNRMESLIVEFHNVVIPEYPSSSSSSWLWNQLWLMLTFWCHSRWLQKRSVVFINVPLEQSIVFTYIAPPVLLAKMFRMDGGFRAQHWVKIACKSVWSYNI